MASTWNTHTHACMSPFSPMQAGRYRVCEKISIDYLKISKGFSKVTCQTIKGFQITISSRGRLVVPKGYPSFKAYIASGYLSPLSSSFLSFSLLLYNAEFIHQWTSKSKSTRQQASRIWIHQIWFNHPCSTTTGIRSITSQTSPEMQLLSAKGAIAMLLSLQISLLL